MGSRLKTRSLLVVLASVALSGAAFYLSEGLYPRWWAIWLAPLPVLCIVPRRSWAVASNISLAAGLIGGLSMWEYHSRLQFPLWLKLVTLVMPAAAFCAGTLLFRVFCRRRRFWLAALAFPSLVVTYEYLTSQVFGTFGATAYTQLNNLPVLQLDVLTGLWGVSFAVMLAPSMLAAILLSPARTRQRLIVAFAAIFTGTLAYGLFRLSATPRVPHSVMVGLAASDLPRNLMPQNDADAMRLMRDYAAQTRLLAQRGAAIVVLPEMTALVRDSVSGDVDQIFEQTAREVHVQILLGVLHATSNAVFNEARLYSESGTVKAVYRKHHLVPVIEGRTTPGNDISVVEEPVGTIGLEVCRDMDYPDPAGRYGKARVGLVLTPAWDFDIDRLWHGHMAILRGIENGFSIVRAAKQGLLTVSDDRGRVLRETQTTPREPFTTMLAAVPVRHDGTLYQSWGDWFAWLNLAVTAGLLLSLVTRRPKEIGPGQKDGLKEMTGYLG